ncbi:MAG: hypothetical protein KKE64_05045 [Candidatus Omnitrophica bacterium]|nr:hypothetical protein [Candidatus Omnitrophota bacterium]
MPKRVLLMHISKVSGHRSASIALEKTLKILAPDTQVLNINAFQYTSPIAEKIANRIYMTVINKAPGIWEYIYDNPAFARRLETWKNLAHKINNPKLKKLFDSFRPDVVACTQAYPCGMVADFKKTYCVDTPLIAVLTDFSPHRYWIYNQVNYFITPSHEISQQFMNAGIPENKLKCLGIPFEHKFNEPVDKEEVHKKLGLNSKVPTILIMGGSHGLGPIKNMLQSLDKANLEFQMLIVAGANMKLYQSLSRDIRTFKKKCALFGYTDKVHELMSISSLIITKPGGITTSEALAKGLPMLIVKPLPGQEANNTAFLTLKNSAIEIEEIKKISLVIEELLKNPIKLKHLKDAALNLSKPNASMDIARLILGL